MGLPCSFFLWWVSSWQSKNLWIVHFLLHTLLTKSLLPPLLCACLLVLALEPRAFLMPGTHSATKLHSSPLLFCCVRGFPWSVGKHSLLVPIAFPPVCVWLCMCVCGLPVCIMVSECAWLTVVSGGVEARGWCQESSSVLHLSFLGVGFLTEPGADSLEWLPASPRDSPASASPVLDYRHRGLRSVFDAGAVGLNSSPYVCIASTLPTEPCSSPWPSVRNYWRLGPPPFFFWFVWDKVSLWNPGWPWTQQRTTCLLMH